MKEISVQTHKTSYGELLIGAFEDKLCLCDWKFRKMRGRIDKRICSNLDAQYKDEVHPIIDQTIAQLDQYFAGERKAFDVPLLFVGSDFQKQVWQALIHVEYGRTSTYLELSESFGNPKAIRAVASANGANAISIIVPCHRIIGSDGKLVGYAGGLKTKQKLLELEQSLFPL